MLSKPHKTLILIRGVSGSGKSTFASIICHKDAICTADDYFYDQEGNYNFDYKQLKQAHEVCQEKCRLLMQMAEPLVVVANTNTKPKDFKIYEDMAKEYDYRVFYLIVEKRHANKNNHNVPDDTVKRMKRELLDSIKL